MRINGKKFGDARKAAGVTRSELAAATGLSHVRIWQLESESESHTNDALGKIMADMMKTTTAELER